MAKQKSKSADAGSKVAFGGARGANLVLLDPEDLVLITDEQHPLFDKRVHNAPEDAMVANIKMFGVKMPIIVRNEGGRPVVVDGRQRVINCREANRQLKREGLATHRIPCIAEQRGSTDADSIGVMILTNELRREDEVLNKAEKAFRLLGTGKTEAEVARTFGVTTQTLHAWLDLRGASAQVKAAVQKGEVGATAAAAIAKLPRTEQEKKLAELKAAAPTSGKRAGKVSARAARQAASGKPAVTRPTVRQIELVRDYAAISELDCSPEEALAWVVGEMSAQAVFGCTLDDMQASLDKAGASPKASSAAAAEV